MIGIPDTDRNRAFVKTRNLIRKVMKKTQLPIGANEKYGYFIIENKKELDGYMKTLQKRIDWVTDRKVRAIVYFENY